VLYKNQTTESKSNCTKLLRTLLRMIIDLLIFWCHLRVGLLVTVRGGIVQSVLCNCYHFLTYYDPV
jgi:hypothetical protein